MRVDKDERGLLKGLSVKRKRFETLARDYLQGDEARASTLFNCPLSQLSECLIVLCHFLLSFDLKRLGKGRYSREGNDELLEPPGVQKLVPPNVNYSHCKG